MCLQPFHYSVCDWQVPICRQAAEPDVADVLPLVKQAAIDDRDILEKGTRAFVSFVRGYKEHKCRFIFRFSSLDIGSLARSFGLLKLPHMAEFRGMDVSSVWALPAWGVGMYA